MPCVIYVLFVRGGISNNDETLKYFTLTPSVTDMISRGTLVTFYEPFHVLLGSVYNLTLYSGELSSR